MIAIPSYNDTKCELDIITDRINFLLDKKIQLYQRYFPVTSKIKTDIVDSGTLERDKMAEYVHELYEVDYGTGMSIQEEIEYQQDRKKHLQVYLDSMTVTLSKLQGIEYKLYYAIVNDCPNITKAVEKTAEATGLDTQTIWKNYYPRIKKYVKKLKNTVKIQ